MVKDYGKQIMLGDEPWWWHDFDDWYSDEDWDTPVKVTSKKNELTGKQLEILKSNKALLQNKNNWEEKVQAFKILLERDSHSDDEREAMRGEFEIRFDGVNFGQRVNCHSYTFPCSVSFNETNFPQGVAFSNAKFLGRAMFNRTQFSENNVQFTGAKFDKEFILRGIFNFSHLELQSIECDGGVEFTLLGVNKFINMSSVKIKKSLKIRGGHVEDLLLVNANIDGNFSIKSKIIRADFPGLSVSGTANFAGCKFENVPDLKDCKLDRPPEVAGMSVPPPIMKPFSCFKFTKALNIGDVAKYRKLKSMALAANDHEKDGEFFAYEMMAKRGHETTGFFPLLLNSLYWLLSGYGQSSGRPFKAMLWSWGVFSVINMIIILCSVRDALSNLTLNLDIPIKEVCFSIWHSLLNIVPLIGGLFRTAAIPDGHESWYDKTYHYLADNDLNIDVLTAFSALQQFLGIIFLFLLILGLRNKFRLK